MTRNQTNHVPIRKRTKSLLIRHQRRSILKQTPAATNHIEHPIRPIISQDLIQILIRHTHRPPRSFPVRPGIMIRRPITNISLRRLQARSLHIPSRLNLRKQIMTSNPLPHALILNLQVTRCLRNVEVHRTHELKQTLASLQVIRMILTCPMAMCSLPLRQLNLQDESSPSAGDPSRGPANVPTNTRMPS